MKRSAFLAILSLPLLKVVQQPTTIKDIADHYGVPDAPIKEFKSITFKPNRFKSAITVMHDIGDIPMRVYYANSQKEN